MKKIRFSKQQVIKELENCKSNPNYQNEKLSEYIANCTEENGVFNEWCLKATFPEIIERFIEINY